MTKFQKKKCLEAAEQKTSKLLVVVCCCKTVGEDIHSDTILVQHVNRRKTVADTDNGKAIAETIRDLQDLLDAYRAGLIVEDFGKA